MRVLVPLLPLAVLLPGLPVLFSAFLAFDRLVRIEFEHFTEAWMDDGMPCPFLTRLPGVRRTFHSWLARGWCSTVWPFVPPPWVDGQPKALRLLRRMRLCVLLWNFVVMPLFILSALLTVFLAG